MIGFVTCFFHPQIVLSSPFAVVLALGAESWRCCRYTASLQHAASLFLSLTTPLLLSCCLVFMEAGFSHGGGASSSSCWGKNGAWSKLRDEPFLARKVASLCFCQI
ncbi:hypothetical protein D1007_61072 [Hordeum vulgare]|uniref:Predicted protein n=1 Tax=Hordeum vulgare subsp. vulgare TaxID=112509 RepID=F2DZJ4_HORVV|nr:hypothetical protein D1007_61072 [Hordeum vulgare]BAK00516.1 predicted protein [Hordeum vulgare subsp. vulgare]